MCDGMLVLYILIFFQHIHCLHKIYCLSLHSSKGVSLLERGSRLILIFWLKKSLSALMACVFTVFSFIFFDANIDSIKSQVV